MSAVTLDIGTSHSRTTEEFYQSTFIDELHMPFLPRTAGFRFAGL